MSAVSAAIEPPPAAPEPPPWRAWTGPAALFLALVAGLVVGSIVYVITAIATGHPRDAPVANMIATVLGDVAFIGSALFFAQLAAPPTPAQFGLRPARLKRALTAMAVGYAVFWVLSGIWLAALGIDTKDHSIDDLGKATAEIAAAGVLVTVIAPIAEEFLFRGYIFTALRAWAGVWGSAAITGVLFGAIHGIGNTPVGFLLPLALFGFVLCLIYWRTGSLYPCIALHSINNAIAFGVAEGLSWQIPLIALGALAAIAALLLPLRRLNTVWPAPV
jgi:uncharacterized protein